MNQNINVNELKTVLESEPNTQLIDVREVPEFNSVKINGATLASLSIYNESCQKIDKNKHAYLLCKSGTRAAQYGEKLIADGYDNFTIVEGGISAWIDSGFETTKGQSKIWALERQVRVAAGSLVLIGVILSFVLHTNFIAISAFVGAGLVFAGLTDTCGMGMMLARMPWNQACKTN